MPAEDRCKISGVGRASDTSMWIPPEVPSRETNGSEFAFPVLWGLEEHESGDFPPLYSFEFGGCFFVMPAWKIPRLRQNGEINQVPAC